MRPLAYMLILFALCGCTHLGDTTIQRGTPITHVQAEYDLPDAISDTSGADTRFYHPTHRPASEWPAHVPRTFYYLRLKLAVTFVHGRAIDAGPIGYRTWKYAVKPVGISKLDTYWGGTSYFWAITAAYRLQVRDGASLGAFMAVIEAARR